MTLEGRVAVVTGGGAGIGRSIVLRLAAEGARVAVLDIRQETAEKSLELAGGDGIALACDVSDSAAVDATFARIEAELGLVEILVNNAGAIGMDHLRRVKPLVAKQRAEAADGGVTTPLDALVRLTDDEWRRMHAIHLDGTFFCTRAAVRAMAPRGRGVVVNMSSVCGLEGCTGQGADRAGHPRQRRGARARRDQHAAGRDQRGACRDRGLDARRPARRPGRDRRHRRVPGVRRRRLLRRRRAQPERRARHRVAQNTGTSV
jgi:NAD(P)-dependent dehydrogenase (short-subunit alcohol dehydrogenase family)